MRPFQQADPATQMMLRHDPVDVHAQRAPARRQRGRRPVATGARLAVASAAVASVLAAVVVF